MSKKRNEIEQLATDAVQRSGLHNLSFRTLAEKSNVKSSSVHYYFPEKSDLAKTLIEKYTLGFSELLAAIDKRDLTVRKKLEAFIKIFEDVVKAEKFCLCGMMAAEVASLDEENRKLLGKYFKQIEKWLQTIFEGHADQINSELKPHQLAKVVMSGLEGAILLDRVEGSRDRLKAQRELVRSLIKD